MRVGRNWRGRAGVVSVSAVALAGALAAPGFGALTTAPAALAVAGMVGVLILSSDDRGASDDRVWPHDRVRPYDRRRCAAVTGTAGVVSLLATAGILAAGELYGAGAIARTPWMFAEIAGLLMLIGLVVRSAPLREAVPAACLAGGAVPTGLLRFGPLEVSAATLGGFGAWSLPPLLAVAIGLYLRSLDERRIRTVLEARRAQRLQLARDLHDFVAHDVSEMLAQAQAGEILAARDADRGAAAFRHIQQAALRALASMDRTVHMLHAADAQPAGDGARAPQPTLADLPALVDRFAAAATTAVQLDVDPQLHTDPPVPADGRVLAAVGLTREVAATVYRVAMEALTNVRRHAPAASHVRIVVHRTRDDRVGGPAVEVSVTDDGVGAAAPGSSARAVADRPARRRGGFGLPGLTERVEALGGSLAAGPHPPSGWRVTAVLPLTAAPATAGTYGSS